MGVMRTADRTLQGLGCLVPPLEIREKKKPQNTKTRVSGPKLPHTSFPWCTMYLTSRPFRAQPLKSKTLISFAGREHNVFQVLLIAGWHSSSLCFWEREQWTLFSFNWSCWKFILLLLSLSARCWAKGHRGKQRGSCREVRMPNTSLLFCFGSEWAAENGGWTDDLTGSSSKAFGKAFSFLLWPCRETYTGDSYKPEMLPGKKISLFLRECSFRRKSGILLNSFVSLLSQPHLGPSSGVCYCRWKAQGHYHW